MAPRKLPVVAATLVRSYPHTFGWVMLVVVVMAIFEFVLRVSS